MGFSKVISTDDAYRNLVISAFMKISESDREMLRQRKNSLETAAVNLNTKPKKSNFFICHPPKTGDITIYNTCKANGVDFFFCGHNTKLFTDNQVRIKITTAIREPISRDLSSLYQGLYSGDAISYPQIQQKALVSFIEQGIPQLAFAQTFLLNTKNEKTHLHRWFDSFGQNIINLLDHPFDQEKGYTIIQTDKYDIFFYQLEKLNDLVPELSEWVGIPFDKLENGNEASSKWIAKSYKQAQKELKFPQEYFDTCYDDPYVQHCYSQEDIERFKDRWKNNIDPSL